MQDGVSSHLFLPRLSTISRYLYVLMVTILFICLCLSLPSCCPVCVERSVCVSWILLEGSYLRYQGNALGLWLTVGLQCSLPILIGTNHCSSLLCDGMHALVGCEHIRPHRVCYSLAGIERKICMSRSSPNFYSTSSSHLYFCLSSASQSAPSEDDRVHRLPVRQQLALS